MLVVLGGDGTIRTAANLCAECGAVLVPLPGGTMNMLPKALYGLVKWEAALANTLAEPTLRQVSGGMVGTEAFYCAAILGAPTLWADVREALRHWRLGEAVTGALKALRRSDVEPLDFAFDQTRGSAQAVVVICSLVSRALDAGEQGLERPPPSTPGARRRRAAGPARPAGRLAQRSRRRDGQGPDDPRHRRRARTLGAGRRGGAAGSQGRGDVPAQGLHRPGPGYPAEPDAGRLSPVRR